MARRKREDMTDEHRLAGFEALVESGKNGGYFIEDADGSFRTWQEMSPEGKLEHIARDAAYYDVPFEPFAEAIRDVLSDLSPAAREEAALRLVLRSVKELHGLEKLLPDEGRTEPPPPLIERCQELLDHGRQRAAKAPGGKGRDLDMER